MFSRQVAMILCVYLFPFGASLAQTPGTTQPQYGIITLHVLVVGHDGMPLTDLSQNELELYEGKEKQTIESISRTPEAPAEIGFLIDNSNSAAGSLRTLKWQDDADPAGDLLRTGDLAFVATFTRTHTLTCPLTSDLGQVKSSFRNALAPPPFQGVTSLYDAIFWASSEEFSAPSSHKTLIVISDMEDNTSEHTRFEAIGPAQQLGISIYPISLQALTSRGLTVADSIASKTGGLTFTDYNLNDLKMTFRRIRSGIDNTYLVAYRSKSAGSSHVKIRCTRKGTRILTPG